MPITEANGQRLYYEVHGEGEPLLCVMGLGADHLAFALQVKEFSKHFKTIVFDNRDVGQSSQSEGAYEITDMAGDAICLADELGLERFHLLGVSLGGTIAQEMALGWGDRIRTLTVCVSWCRSGAWGRKRGRLWGEAVKRTPFEEHIDNLMLLCFTQELFENTEEVTFLRSAIVGNPFPQSAEAFARQAEAGGRHDAAERLPSLDLPVHVIGAEHDILVPVWKSREIAELVPNAKLTILEGAAHGANVEHAGEFNAAVLEFLRSEERAAA
jgi:3-oxoadipate enol-lactonase